MTEQNNRVFARIGARSLTDAEMAEVRSGFSSPVLFTQQLTNLGKDHFPDEVAA
jgi:hypothetical protein